MGFIFGSPTFFKCAKKGVCLCCKTSLWKRSSQPPSTSKGNGIYRDLESEGKDKEKHWFEKYKLHQTEHSGIECLTIKNL